MATKEYNLQMDIKQKLGSEPITFVQGDVNTNILNIQITEDDIPVDLTNATLVTLTMKKSDNTTVVGTCVITNPLQGMVKYICGTNDIAAQGNVVFTVEIYHDKDRISTTQNKFKVIGELGGDGTIQSTTEYPILLNLINEVQSGEATRQGNENTRITNETSRQSAESNRVSEFNGMKTTFSTFQTNNDTMQANETTRQSNETQRINSENTRISQEQTRVTAENTRQTNETAREQLKSDLETLQTSLNNAASQETVRQSNETTRQNQETTRQNNESARVTAESQRVTEFDNMKTSFNNAQLADMRTSIYDTNMNGKVDVAEVAESVDWNNVQNKPTDLETTEGSQSKASTAETNAKNYTDQQIQTVTATGIPKLVTYEYDLYATVEGQTVFEIPYDYLNYPDDTVEVLPSGIDVPVSYFSITNPVTNPDNSITKGYITLNSGRPLNSFIKVRIHKNMPIGPDGAIQGTVMAIDSIPLNRVIDGASATELQNLNNTIDEHKAESVTKTTSDKTYYVNVSTGLDTNDGLTNSTAFKTIAKAVSMIPDFSKNTTYINIADGTYNEDVVISDKVCGYITITGNTTTPTNCKVNSIQTNHIYGRILIQGFTATSTTKDGFSINYTNSCVIANCTCTAVASGTATGITFSVSIGRIQSTTISNRYVGINATFYSMVYCDSNGGTNNNIGLYSQYTSLLGKRDNNQPSGSTMQGSNASGKIVESIQVSNLNNIGYRYNDDGTIEQWGYITVNNVQANALQYFTANLPIAFPVTALNLSSQVGATGTNAPYICASSVTTTQVTITVKNDSNIQNITVWYRAIGR